VTYRDIETAGGHDSFLLEIEPYHETVRAYIDRALEVLP
jgi:homoserine O-acetyltransferase